MNDVLRDLYSISEEALPGNERLVVLVEECRRAEHRVEVIIQNFSTPQRELIEEYMNLRDKVELQAVRQALKFGKLYK